MPAMAIIARRPLLSSLVCISLSSAALAGLRPRGSKPRSPGEWSVLIECLEEVANHLLAPQGGAAYVHCFGGHGRAGIVAACVLGLAFGWPAERAIRTIDTLGNCVAASIPLTLHEGIASGKIRRGDKCVLFGTGAGLSFGGIVLTY